MSELNPYEAPQDNFEKSQNGTLQKNPDRALANFSLSILFVIQLIALLVMLNCWFKLLSIWGDDQRALSRGMNFFALSSAGIAASCASILIVLAVKRRSVWIVIPQLALFVFLIAYLYQGIF